MSSAGRRSWQLLTASRCAGAWDTAASIGCDLPRIACTCEDAINALLIRIEPTL